jgi:NCS1 family nucleobase:cation symporter-1
MERIKRSKVAHWSNKLAVESEPNLTTAQLMLFNHDLKPVGILLPFTWPEC